jgi:DNA segregation ATPase FtsK/SpoIIIE-like protein
MSGSDPRFSEARSMVVQAGKASASFLQRRMSIGYARAARLLDLLEEEGTIGPGEGAKPRDVLLTVDDLNAQEHPLEEDDGNRESRIKNQEDDGDAASEDEDDFAR